MKKFFLLLFFLLPSVSHAAIAFDAASDGGSTLQASPYSWNHTVTGSNTLLIVCVHETTLTQKTTGVTYNSVAMSFVGYKPDTNNEGMSMWILPGASTGTHSITITSTANTSGVGVSYTGAAQSGQPDSKNTANFTGTTFNISTTVVASNSWLVGCMSDQGFATSAAGTGTTLRQSAGNSNPWGTAAALDSNGTVGTGSQTLQGTNTFGSDPWTGVIASIAPFTAPAVVPSWGTLTFWNWW